MKINNIEYLNNPNVNIKIFQNNNDNSLDVVIKVQDNEIVTIAKNKSYFNQILFILIFIITFIVSGCASKPYTKEEVQMNGISLILRKNLPNNSEDKVIFKNLKFVEYNQKENDLILHFEDGTVIDGVIWDPNRLKLMCTMGEMTIKNGKFYLLSDDKNKTPILIESKRK